MIYVISVVGLDDVGLTRIPYFPGNKVMFAVLLTLNKECCMTEILFRVHTPAQKKPTPCDARYPKIDIGSPFWVHRNSEVTADLTKPQVFKISMN